MLESKLSQLLETQGWLQDDIERYQTDWLKQQSHPPLGVARPTTSEQVAKIVNLARNYDISITPQGGNTSLCAGAVPGRPGCIILSLERMNQIETIDTLEFNITVGAGTVLRKLHEKLLNHQLIFPMHLGAEGSSQIGGLIATNAGGSHALRYGMMQDLVLGLEAVMPDGRIWNGLRKVQKDNSGLQLRKILCGSEGTLGIITKASLQLFPKPVQSVTALLSLANFNDVVKLGAILRKELGEFLSALEFFSDTGLILALKHRPGVIYPMKTRDNVYVLVEVSSSSSLLPLNEMVESVLGSVLENGLVSDGMIACNDTQRAMLWRLREEMPEGQRLESAQLKHDISVPVTKLHKFIDCMVSKLEKILPGIRINPFGHLGDGNIHYNLSPPIGKYDFGLTRSKLSQEVYEAAEQLGGSFAAEHGLGRTKICYADNLRSQVEREYTAQIKKSFDPTKLMNPGVIFCDNK